jgi:hypothetical protein
VPHYTAALLATLKAEAVKANMPTQRLIRMMIETQLAESDSKAKRNAAAKRSTRADKRRSTARNEIGI